jgi:DNA helicase-2/ATP-dependent DNA helicase PcrA
MPYKEYLASKDISLKDGTVLSLISKAKAKGHSSEDIFEQNQHHKTESQATGVKAPHDIETIVMEVYKEYEKFLRKSNSLDFDDLLIFGVKLFSQHEKAVSWCRHVMVDELWVI